MLLVYCVLYFLYLVSCILYFVYLWRQDNNISILPAEHYRSPQALRPQSLLDNRFTLTVRYLTKEPDIWLFNEADIWYLISWTLCWTIWASWTIYLSGIHLLKQIFDWYYSDKPNIVVLLIRYFICIDFMQNLMKHRYHKPDVCLTLFLRSDSKIDFTEELGIGEQ